ncbi:PD-(D/E)XK nuclease family protein [Leptodesmis sp.]|uniref:PD-(D/E)XK nuclease family protein n=1 Tax=Leptodesmis sp. TaxID=3100501 RepID=UPI0040534E0F
MGEIQDPSLYSLYSFPSPSSSPPPPSPFLYPPRPSPPPLRLSQGHLTLLSTCPRKFQYVIVEQLGSPNPPEEQEKLNQGSRFHLLLQQWQLDLPVESFVQEDPQLNGWFQGFLQAVPQILTLNSNHQTGEHNELYQSEHQRALEFQGYLLTVVYDLLISNPHQARILDWKTYPRPRNVQWLKQNWQTRLYPFVLAETSPYAPEQISMVYWFFQSQSNDSSPQSLLFQYDRAQHEQTRQDLTHLLTQLTHWLERYYTGEPFPQTSIDALACQECSFAVRCDRISPQRKNFTTASNTSEAASHPELPLPLTLPALADIEEIPL